MGKDRLRAFYTPRRNGKRVEKITRYPFVSFEYVAGGQVDKQLAAIQDYLVIKYKSRAARVAVTITAKSATVTAIRKLLANLVVESGQRAMLRIEALPNEVDLALVDALDRVKVLIATVQGVEASSITNKLAYEVSIGYVAARVAKYAKEDAQE